jgi:hypothetical protein
MVKTYKMVRVPVEVYNQLQKKGELISRDIKFMTDKDVRISMPRLLKIVSYNKIEMDKTGDEINK